MGAPAAAYAMSLGLRVDRAVFIGPPASQYEYLLQWTKSLSFSVVLTSLTKARVEVRVGETFERLRAKHRTCGSVHRH